MKTRVRTAVTATAVVASALSLAVAVPSGATTPPQSETYSQPYVGGAYETGGRLLDTVNDAGAFFAVPAWARYYSVEIADNSGLPTVGDLWADDGSGVSPKVDTFCGRTTHSYPVDPTVVKRVWVTVDEGPCSDLTLGAATVGTISITFTS